MERERKNNKQIMLMSFDKKSAQLMRDIKQSIQLSAPEKAFAHVFFNYENASQIYSMADFN